MAVRVPGNVSVPASGFRAPEAGGANGGPKGVAHGEFTFTATATAQELFTLPAGARVTDWHIEITEDFDAGTDNDLNVGTAADGDFFAAAIDIGTAGVFRAGVSGTVAGRLGTLYSEDTVITVTYAQSGTDATTGAGILFVEYIMESPD